MPVRPKRVCRSQGCGNVTDKADGYCEQCTDAGRNDSAERRRAKTTDPFYLSPEWRKYTRWWLSQHPLCASCKRPGRIVDHIKPISEGGERLDPANTQTMCSRCHNQKTGRERADRGRSKSPRPFR